MRGNYIKWISGSLLFIAVTVVILFSSMQKNQQLSGIPEVSIQVPGEMIFLTKEDILNHLKKKNLIGDSMAYKNINVGKIERELKELQNLEKVKVYKSLNGELTIDVTIREPIARVMTQQETSYYIDRKGAIMPLSPNYTAHVLVFTGQLEQTPFKTAYEAMHQDSIPDALFDDIYAIASVVHEDEFLSDLITQVYVNEWKEFELIPRVGDFRIFLGTTEKLTDKMDNLKILYREGLKNTGWNAYDSIYLKFENQVVCSKRE